MHIAQGTEILFLGNSYTVHKMCIAGQHTICQVYNDVQDNLVLSLQVVATGAINAHRRFYADSTDTTV